MWLYLIIFAIPLFAYIKGGPVNRNKKFLLYYMGFLSLFVGLSDMLGGYDRYIYGETFDGIADAISMGDNPLKTSHFWYYEVGFSLLSTFIALITENRYIFILILTLVIYFNFYKVFERHFTNYPLAFIMFLGMMFFFTFTYLRQVVAFSFAWLGIQSLLDKKRALFLVFVVITAMLHKSGIVFAGLLFLPLKKWKPVTIVIIMLICGVIGISGVTSSLYDAVMTSGIIADQGNEYNASGNARIAYILEVVFFLWVILRNYDRIEPTRQNLIFLNMALAYCGLLLLFVRSSDGGRVAWFFTIGIIYIITLIGSHHKAKVFRSVRNYVAPLIIVVMFALYIRVYTSWQVYNNLYPYKSFLTDGYRSPDYAYDHYEYDFDYTKDKFYRPAFRFMK